MRLALLSIVAVLASAGRADLIDRVAVSVANSIITESEFLRQIRLAAFLNGEKPDFSPANKRSTAERLVEQALIRREISLGHFLPSNSDAPPDLYRDFRAKFGPATAWEEALRAYNITDAEVRDAFRWQATLLDFIDLRFRPGIQVSEEDIRDYYDTQLAGKTMPQESFDDVRAKIEEVLVGERVNAALDRWLGQARTQTQIRYREEVFR